MNKDADDLRKQAAELIRQAEELERLTPPGDVGTVIRFMHSYAVHGPVYTVVALHTKTGWQSTAGLHTRPRAWHTMCRDYPALARGEFDIVLEWGGNLGWVV